MKGTQRSEKPVVVRVCVFGDSKTLLLSDCEQSLDYSSRVPISTPCETKLREPSTPLHTNLAYLPSANSPKARSNRRRIGRRNQPQPHASHALFAADSR
jgi:hypothetical protein